MREDLRTNFLTRQYMLSEDFEIYYYSDKHLKGAGSHIHDYYEFYFFISGDVSMCIGDETFPLQSGDMIMIPPNIPHHAIIADSDTVYSRFVFWISNSYCNQLIQLSSAYGYILQRASLKRSYIYHYETIEFNALQSKIFTLIQEIQMSRYGREAKISLSINDLLLDINRTAYEAEHPRENRETTGLYENLITYIDNHLSDELSLDELASQFYVSKYHIAHLFKESLGLSIHQYIIKKRLNLFRDYLSGSMDINQAYLLCGFSDYSSFYRAFKKEYGISPNDYKNEIANRSKNIKKQSKSYF